ncbi:sushi, von Willebrand factor type A, EGF and pentraxin domain-containing protein 1-like isoform X2 [Bolinopsis microptera]|uniref:sushi, von Willebrand factor type A, EGF and pentraxin domain-containing protein 1-like isoform X2 n=1 Tax=Bolinopsis microptera TaxID=2820187 RepID=UPI00307998BF
MMRVHQKVNLGVVLLFILTGPTIGFNTTDGSRLVDRRQFALKFGDTLEDFIMFQPDMSPLQNALTVCSWVKSLSSNIRPTWLSYATSSHQHEIWISDNGDRNYFLDSSLDLSSEINPSKGTWYHYCTSWSTSSNTRKVYFNGELVGQGATPSRTFGLDGFLFFGNENHYDGGSRSASEIFGGELFKVNFFAKELTGEEVLEMKEAGLCSDVEESYGRVRYLRWEDLLLEQRNGNITEVEPGCPARTCPTEKEETEEPTPGSREGRNDAAEKNRTECECEEKKEITQWDILYSEDIFNRTLPVDLLEKIRSYWDILGVTITESVITHFKIFQSCSD